MQPPRLARRLHRTLSLFSTALWTDFVSPAAASLSAVEVREADRHTSSVTDRRPRPLVTAVPFCRARSVSSQKKHGQSGKPNQDRREHCRPRVGNQNKSHHAPNGCRDKYKYRSPDSTRSRCSVRSVVGLIAPGFVKYVRVTIGSLFGFDQFPSNNS